MREAADDSSAPEPRDASPSGRNQELQALSNRHVNLVKYVGTLPCGSRHGRCVRNVLHLPPSVPANKRRLPGRQPDALWLQRRLHRTAPTRRRTCSPTGAGGPTPRTASDARCKGVASWLPRQLTVQRLFTWAPHSTPPACGRALVSSVSVDHAGRGRRGRSARENLRTPSCFPLSHSCATVSSGGEEPEPQPMRWQR